MRAKYPPPRPEGLITIVEACALLDLSRRTFYTYREQSDFPRPVEYREGQTTFYRRHEIEAWRERRS